MADYEERAILEALEECGGNRRQKASAGGLQARGATPEVTTSINGRWNVMMIRRGDGGAHPRSQIVSNGLRQRCIHLWRRKR